MFNIDSIINRTLVYGILTAFVVGTYVLVVGVIGLFLHFRGGMHIFTDLLLSLTATGVVAIFFQPIRERLQYFVNHLMVGERDEPYKVLTRLGRRLGASVTPESIFPTIVETIAQALRLPYVAL